jgi:hypothetical protein
MTQRAFPHRKILLIAFVTSLLSTGVLAMLHGGAPPMRLLGWGLSTFVLIYTTLLVTGRPGRSCLRDS